MLDSVRFWLVNIVCAVCFAAALGLWLRVHRQERKERKSEKERQAARAKLIVSLEAICPVWTLDGSGQHIRAEVGTDEKFRVKLGDLAAATWRPNENAPAAEPDDAACDIELKNTRAANFYKKFRKANKGQRGIIAQLLQMLDAEECASVVSQQVTQDIEATWDALSYRKLGATTLLDHSLNVAEEIIDQLNKDGSGHMVNDAVIAALGHDIGKLPSKQSNIYATGDHALTSAAVLSCIPGFKELSQKDRIIAMIKHHHKSPDNYLEQSLKTADSRARQLETELWDEQHPLETLSTEPPTAQEAQKVRNAQRDIYGEEPPAGEKVEVISKINISWLDSERCLSEIKRHINIMRGNTFKAFSMPDGTVYVQPGLLGDVVMAQAALVGDTEVSLRDRRNNQVMRPVLLAAVDILRDRGIIERSMIQDGYFGGKFDLKDKNGKVFLSGYYTPFRGEAFLAEGESIGEMEARKTGQLKDIGSVEVKK